MKLCIKCYRELFDFDEKCDKCGSNNLIVTSLEEIQKITKEIETSNPIKRKHLLKDNKYNIIYHYKLNLFDCNFLNI